MTINQVELSYQELPFLSGQQIANHYKLYQGYVGKVNEIRETYSGIDNYDTANATYSQIRELKLEEGFALNGVNLHELYFSNIEGDGNLNDKTQQLISNSFGSVESWQSQFLALGLSSRGWVVMALDSDGILRNYICDWHSQGGVWGSQPILVLDVYEHAYFTDYGTDRKSYIESFIKHINWGVVESRLGTDYQGQ